MSGAIERRSFEIRAVPETSGAVLEGVAVPWDSPGRVGRFTETFKRGSLNFDGDVLVNVQHESSRVVARNTPAGGLALWDDPKGLMSRINLPDTQEGRDTRTLVSQGILAGLSIEFRALEDRWAGSHRTVLKAELDAIGIVSRPAYAGATISEGRSVESATYLENRQDRAGSASGSIPYNSSLACECLQNANCSNVEFQRIEIADDDEIIATIRGFENAFASTRDGSLSLTQTDEGLAVGLSASAFETESGQTLLEQAERGVLIYARPIVDESISEFEDIDGIRIFSLARIRALIIKAILGDPKYREGWTPLEFPGLSRRSKIIWPSL